MKTGFGTYAVQAGNIKVGAMVAVNAAGDVYGADGKVMAGLLSEDRKSLSSSFEAMIQGLEVQAGVNTTIGCVVTNVKLPKAKLCKVAGMTHNGYARAIRPVHTSGDGDSIYALSTGEVEGSMDAVGTLAAYAMEQAIRRAAETAESAYGYLARRDFL